MKKKFGFFQAAAVSAAMVGFLISGCGSSGSQNAASGNNSGTGSDYPKMEIKFSHVAAPDTPKGQSALKFKEFVESKSGGNISVKVYPNGQLYGDNDEIEALQANNVQFIAPSSAKLGGFDKSFELFDLPFLFKDEKHLEAFEDGQAGKQLLSKVNSNNMEGLAFWPNGFKHITNSKRPIAKPEDLKGLKIRTHGGEIINDVYTALGAASTKLAFNETYQGLQLGTVDGQENSLVNIETQKYEEVQKYLTLTNHARSEYVVVTNKKWWDGLNAKTKDLLTQAMKEATSVGRNLVEKEEKEALDNIKKHNKMQIHQLTPEERQTFLKTLKPVSEKWGKDIDPNLLKAIDELAK
ncbi:DctP family TRAP transporter solute-binding subunit [Effusibacillus dendaii]|uniref:C4-dicarboxylate ABC transporter n=1 Tax=Effusibacillus dendaii TaxID=2743772 RepID=A0A7I8D9K8_9BACL|nr:DctP family TRAP transporter solute-binding subunit [Effusibacillus dendaii]BCJ86765.1 C4-dicarboxylate ABC transporter [Effusibacillus dendaii]